MREPARLLSAALCALAFSAMAAEPPEAPNDELDALTLADQAPDAPAAAQRWRAYLEGAGFSRRLGADPDAKAAGRASLDARFDGTLTPGLRLVLSDRLDLMRDNADPAIDSVNTVREAYLSWSVSDSQTLDLGRVNVRHGAAMGYNPTDWFKTGALRGVVSPDPAALRENRQGTVVLQGQQLWPAGGLTLSLSPRLERVRDDDTFAFDAGATNARNRWLLAGSLKIAEGWTPEVLLHGAEGSSPQLGFNLSTLAGDAVVVYGEATFGKGPSLVDQALQTGGRDRMQRRASLGLTYTTPFNLSLTVEAQYASAAPDRSQWNALPSIAAAAPLQLLSVAGDLQDLPARRGAFVYATWKDAFVRRLDLSAFVRQELETDSREQWLELRHRWDRFDLAAQVLVHSGDAGSVYRSIPQRRSLELSLRYYL